MRIPSAASLTLRRADLFRALFAGWLVAVLVVPYSLALATVIFTGPLQPFVADGARMMLFGAAVFCSVVAVTSGYRGSLAEPQEIPAAVLGTIGAAVGSAMAHAPPRAAFITMTVVLVLSSLSAGLAFLTIGRLRLSNLLRFIPFPVSAGLFAGTGWSLSLAALSMMTATRLDWLSLPRLFDPAMLWRWVPGTAYGLVLLFVMKRWNPVATLVGSFLLLTGLTHAVFFALDMSLEDARSASLLMSGSPDGGLWPGFAPGDLARVDWSVVAGQMPAVFVVVMATLLCALMCLNGLEVLTGKRLDLDREFRATGLAGVVASVGGSAPGTHSLVLSVASRVLGADNRWTGILAAFWLCLALFFGGEAMAVFPNAVIGGMLLLFGVDLMITWLVQVRKRLEWTDYTVVLLIALTIAIFGFIEGFAVGMLATLVLFAIRLTRMELIAEILTGRELQSNKVRSVPDRAILLNQGERIRIFRLQGFVFFGSVYRLVDRLEECLRDCRGPALAVLDCTSVLGFDVSTINVLGRYLQAADSNGTRVVICSPPAQLRTNLRRELPPPVRARVLFEADLDHGLERCEEMVIAAFQQYLADSGEHSHGDLLERVADDVERHLDRQAVFEELVESLEPWTEQRRHEAGDNLAESDGVHDGMQLVVTGRVSVRDPAGRRLFQCGPGGVVERQAAFRVRRVAARTVAEEPSVTVVLTPAARRLLEAAEPELSLELYRYMMTDPT